MRKLLSCCLLASLNLSCSPDPTIDKAHFPAQIAQAICHYYFTCCLDTAQRQQKTQAASETDCTNQMTTQYTTMYQAADPRMWDGKAGQACVDQVTQASAQVPGSQVNPQFCPKGYDPTAVVATTCTMIAPTLQVGDVGCAYNWQCGTHFCHGGTCAKPIPAGSTCQAGDPCATGSACVNGSCLAQKPDGSSCTVSAECLSASCGGGVCVNSTRYACDGQP